MRLAARPGTGWIVVLAVLAVASTASADPPAVFRAGAVAIDVSPLEFPVIINGGMLQRTADKIVDRLHARCLVLDDGQEQVAVVVVDSCMIPRRLLDEAKRQAAEMTGLRIDRMLISATHTHSAPSVAGCLGSDEDERYSRFLVPQIAKGIARAHANLRPARIGWAVGTDRGNVFIRRYLMKPDTATTNRFSGKSNDRAQMNPGYGNENAIGPIGAPDTDVTVVSIQTLDGEPLALLANYSTHYAGAPAVSSDYFGAFCDKMVEWLDSRSEGGSSLVAMMSNGTSGDANCLDFRRSRRRFDRHQVADDVARAALAAHARIRFFDWVPLVMEEAQLTLDVRMPSENEVTEARRFLEELGDRPPTNVEEVYARETILLAEGRPTRELKLQAIRLGELGIAAIPNEVYSSTGLRIKADSPLETTFTIELANGCEGYIPPPDQHLLGGYTTWRARTSCLEVEAEPKIQAAVVGLLRSVAARRAGESPVPSAR